MNNETIKSYNPFKMWGSWAGFVLGMISFVLPFVRLGPSSPIRNIAESTLWGNPFAWLPITTFGDGEGEFILLNFLSILTTPIFLFLWGWGVHSLFRKFSK